MDYQSASSLSLANPSRPDPECIKGTPSSMLNLTAFFLLSRSINHRFGPYTEVKITFEADLAAMPSHDWYKIGRRERLIKIVKQGQNGEYD